MENKVNLELIKDHLRDELQPARGQEGKYICPLCGSGSHGANSTAAFSIMKDGVHGHCFSCLFTGDIVDLTAARDGISAAEATRQLIDKYQPGAVRSYSTSAKSGFTDHVINPSQAPAAETARKSYLQDVEKAHAALKGSEGEQYLKDRGFTDETMERFMMGYEASHYFPGRGTFAAVVFPYDKGGHYLGWRAIKEKHFDKPKTAEAGPEPVFNVAALYSGDPVFVVESQLDAITIEQEGGHAVAIGGGGLRKLQSQIEKKAPAGELILCFDMDEAGREDTRKAAAWLDEKGIFCVDGAASIMGDDCKDPNEVLTTKGPDKLRRAIMATMEETREQHQQILQAAEDERRDRTGRGMIDSFFDDIQSRKYEPIPTGIKDIDEALDGGFIRQQLISLGAAPGAGKTALAQWIFEGLATRGYDSIFLNLEMSRNQILARSFSRYMAQRGLKISNVRMLRAYLWTDEERAAIMAAKEEYTREIASHMVYNPDGLTPDLDSIMKYLDDEAQRAEVQGRQAPFVILDYLQIIRGGEREDGTELIKRAIVTLKDFAVKHNTVVFLIMAHNRKSNETGAVTMESGRDTSAIEYSGDTQIGLTFTHCLKGWIDENNKVQDKGKSPDELTDDERKLITLKIVKGRFGGAGRRVDLRFDGETMTYTQLLKGYTKVDGITAGIPGEWTGAEQPNDEPVVMARGRRKMR